MNGPTSQSLSERLDRLERHNHYLKLAGALMVIGLVAGALTGPAVGSSPVVEAEKFILKDRSGRVRAAFGLGGDGSPVLAFNDEDGMTRLVLGILDGQPQLNFASRGGKVVWKAPSSGEGK
jgi:hypothetical protein